MDIDRASGTCAWLLHLFPGDKSPGYKIARSDAASCLNNSRASLDTICERWLNPFSGCVDVVVVILLPTSRTYGTGSMAETEILRVGPLPELSASTGSDSLGFLRKSPCVYLCP